MSREEDGSARWRVDAGDPVIPSGPIDESQVRDDVDMFDPTKLVAYEATDNVIYVDFRRD